MATECATINFVKYGGIYYTDQITYTGSTVLTCSKLVFTTDAALKDTRINEVSGKQVQSEIIKIREKT